MSPPSIVIVCLSVCPVVPKVEDVVPEFIDPNFDPDAEVLGVSLSLRCL